MSEDDYQTWPSDPLVLADEVVKMRRAVFPKTKWVQIVTDAESRAIAKARHNAKLSGGTKRFFKDKYHEDNLGVKGEIAFGRIFNLPVNTEAYQHGDGLVDFEITYEFEKITIDVKSADKPVFLLVKEKDILRCADILVLAHAKDDRVLFLGWSTREIMQKMPKKDFGYEIVSHFQHVDDLKPMDDLKLPIRK